MCMLNKRTQLLLNQEVWEDLLRLAEEKNTSVGQLVRLAVMETYFGDRKREKMRRALQRIMSIRPHLKGRVNYEELINAGRER